MRSWSRRGAPSPALPSRRRGRGAAGALLCLLLAAGGARAQETVDIADLTLESLLDPELVAASRRPEKSSDAPATVFVLTAEDLRRYGFRTIAEALASVPGLSVSDQRSYQFLGVRGLNQQDDYSTHVLVLIDGHAINNSGLDNTYLSRDLPVTLAALDHIEVIFGPAGGVYGPFAFFAVLNLVTSAGHEGTAVFVAADSDGTRPNALEAGATVDRKAGPLELFLHAGLFRSRGHDFAFPALAQATDRPAPPGGAVPGTDFNEAQNLYARLSWRDLTLSLGFASRTQGDPFASYQSIVGDTRNQWGNRIGFAALAWERQVAPEVRLLARVSWDAARATDTFVYPDPPAGAGPTRDFARDTFWSAEMRTELRPWERTRATLGFEGELHDTLQLYTADLLPPLSVDPENGAGTGPIAKAYRSLNGYALVEQGLGSAWSLQAGLNLYASSMVDACATGKLAAVLRLGAADTFKLVWAQGFRPPSVSESLYDDDSSYIPNHALRPERAESFEGVWEHRFGGAASLRVNAFRSAYRDLISYRSTPAPGLDHPPDPENPADYRLQAQNVGATNVLGAEAAFRLQLGNALQGYGGVSISRPGFAADAAESANFARETATLSLSTRLPWQPLALSLNGQFVSARPLATVPGDPAPGSVPASLRLHASARLALGATGFFAQLSATNLFATSLQEPLPADQLPLRSYDVPGRGAHLMLEYRK